MRLIGFELRNSTKSCPQEIWQHDGVLDEIFARVLDVEIEKLPEASLDMITDKIIEAGRNKRNHENSTI